MKTIPMTVMIAVSMMWMNAHAATFTVTTADDSGAGSLRDAIDQANATNGVDTIEFNIPGAGVHTINLTNALPEITDPVIMDGYSQPGASVNTLTNGDDAVILIELNGQESPGPGLNIMAGNSTVRGLAINRFTGAVAQINITGGGTNVIEGNFIGTDATGTNALSGNFGVLISGSATSGGDNHLIGGSTPAARNVIAGSGHGILICDSVGNLVEGNFIGTDRTGTNALGNNTGITITFCTQFSSSNNVVQANVISGNGIYGVLLSGPDNVMQGNFIGTDVTGTQALANDTGIRIESAFNRIGGTQPSQRNVISGNVDTGLNFVQGDAATDNLVQGNLIGTDAQGLSAVPNGQGIRLYSHRNVLGGTNATARNVISGNTGDGIDLLTGNSNTVQGCYVGIDAAGSAKLPNAIGLRMQVASHNIIGGSAPGAGNTIGGNDDSGIALLGGSFNQFDGNFVGTDSTGTANLGNAIDGFTIGGAVGASNNIGSAAANLIAFNGERGLDCGSGVDFTTIEGNLIYSNGTQGVVVSSLRYRITGNSIVNNGLLGIDLFTGGGVNANDPCDADSDGNELQNYPVLTSANTTGGVTTVIGTLPSAASTTYQVEFFANTDCDPSGFGEGEFYLGFTNVTTAGNCTGTFTFVTADLVFGCDFITATATDPEGNTSEFSACIPVTTACVPAPDNMIAWWPGDGNANDIIGGNNGVLSNGVTFATGMVGQAFTFDGVNDSVALAASPTWNFGTNDFTVDFWAVSTNSTRRMHALSLGADSIVQNLSFNFNDPDPTGQSQPPVGLWVYWNGTGVNQVIAGAPGEFTDGQWHFYALTRNGTTLRLYVDGVEVDSASYSDPIDLSNSGTSYIGASGLGVGGTTTNFWDGQIDEVEVFDRALSAEEIRTLYCAGSSGKCKPEGTPICSLTPLVDTNVVGQTHIVTVTVTTNGSPVAGLEVSFSVNGAHTIAVTNVTTAGNGQAQFSYIGTSTGTDTILAAGGILSGEFSCDATKVWISESSTNLPPVAICQDVITNANGSCQANVTAASVDNGSSDPDGISVTLSLSPTGPYNKGTNNVTLIVVDANSATDSCPAKVIVVDATPPLITQCASNQTASANANCQAAVPNMTNGLAATDACSGVLTITQNPTAGTLVELGTNTVVLTVKDTANNATACTNQFIVRDTTAPSIDCPDTIVTNVAAGVSNAVVNYTAPIVTDNCGPIVFTNSSPASGTSFELGTNTVTSTAVDGSGNTNSCTFKIIVSTEPVGPCPDLTGTWTNLVQTCKVKKEVTSCKVKGTLMVQNIGTEDADTSFVRYFLSSDETLDKGDTLLKQVATGAVKLSKPKKRTLSAKLPVGIDGAGQYIIAVIDADEQIDECNEENNIVVFGPLP